MKGSSSVKKEKPLCVCPQCGKKCKGRQALSSHISKAHPGDRSLVSERIVSFVKNEKNLSGMLRAVAKQLEEQNGDIEFSDEFKTELRIQDAKMQLAIRLIGYDKIKKALQTSSQIGEISDAIARRFGTEFDLEKTPIQILMRIRENLDRALERDLDFLREISGFRSSESDESIILQFIQAITQMNRSVAVKEGSVSSTPIGLIPSDPQDRENVRRILQLQQQREAV